MNNESIHPNATWSAAMVDELVRNGVEQFCLAPGSRCTPLVEAVARHPLARTHGHFDERGLGFFALGLARAIRRPVVLITTSGTAVANVLPAVIEAAQDRVPLILLTADRPPELRATEANQTMVQPGLFDPYLRWSVDVPCPTGEIDISYVLTTIDQACYLARRAPAGPVHLNAMFREPLSAQGVHTWEREGEGPWTTYADVARVAGERVVEDVVDHLRVAKRGVFIVGCLDDRATAEAVLQWADELGWPMLPDITSGLRLTEGSTSLIAHYDTLGSFFDDVDTVLHVGGRCVSKALLEIEPSTYVQVAGHPNRHDPNHRVTYRVEAQVRGLCEQLRERLDPPSPTPWLARWQEADRRVADHLQAFSSEAETVSEPWVARHVAAHLPSDQGLFAASSMPVRDLNRYAPVRPGTVQVAANRGVSGIDGTVASAAGFTNGLQAAVTLLIGDLALLHDLNSLALLRNSPYPVILVAINNNGGGIFHFLPVVGSTDVFEPYFGTPHGMGFADAAHQFGIEYSLAESPEAFAEAYAGAAQGDSSMLIEVRTDRAENLALHRRLDEEIRALIG